MVYRYDILKEALMQAKAGRLHILEQIDRDNLRSLELN